MHVMHHSSFIHQNILSPCCIYVLSGRENSFKTVCVFCRMLLFIVSSDYNDLDEFLQ